jgi:5-methylcytosine-specific restriction endonuclease McrA
MSTRTLLLTAWYFPVRVLRWEDAVKMIYENTVDVVAEYDEDLRSPSVTWKMPAVVRLRRNVGDRKRAVKFSRMNVYQRDHFTCQYCAKKFRWGELTYDHLVPRSRGGRTNFLNIVTACKPCNAQKGNLTCDEAGMFPITEPAQPKSLPLASPWVYGGSVPEEWEPYLAPYAAM